MESGGRSKVRADVWRRYADFLSLPPHTVVEWHDPATTARGWLVVNSWRGGAAGGGTRMRPGCTRDEVVFLAKAMELKFSISGPAIGGAKAGIDFDPEDPRKREVLRRWFSAILPYLKTSYSTAGDLNVDEVREVIPLCSELGLLHPQQGLARGHLGLTGEAMERRLDAVRQGLGQVVGSELGLPDARQRVADLVTGFGVAVSASRLLERQGTSLDGARVLVEGFGRVGGAAALYLTRWGARIVGIIDIRNALVSRDGLGADEIEELLKERTTNRLPVSRSSSAEGSPRDQFHAVPADICVCAASSGTVDGSMMDRLADQGVRALVSGANRPFASSFPGDTSIDREADDRFAVVADIIANCGTAHAFAYQIELDEPATPVEVFDSVEVTISGALDEAIARAGSSERGLLGAALESTLERTGAVEEP